MNRLQLIGFRPKTAEEWLYNLDKLTSNLSLLKEEDRAKFPPTKIAILDTGVKKECYETYKDNICEYKDFVSQLDNNPRDGTGHGSSTLRLLLRLYEDAKIYVGRVFQRQEADDDTEMLMAKVSL